MRQKTDIPKANKAFIGGSSTFAINFPEDLNLSGMRVIHKKNFSTPFGESPEITSCEMDGETVLMVKMHGWRAGVRRADASRQIFWVFGQAGIRNILVEGGVGVINSDFALRDFIIPDDYIDFSMRKDVSLSDKYLLIMRDPVCPTLAELLMKTARKIVPDRKVHRGVYAVTDGRHFESRAEVRMIASSGGDVIGQSLCPEVYLAREIGACYAGIYLIVNRAEGIGPDWKHGELKAIFYEEAIAAGKIVIESLKKIKQKKGCQCSRLRKKTLLK